MSELPPPDSHHLSAAIGWLGLGNPNEARLDLQKISPQFREHPDVLEAEWAILAAEQNWDEALVLARKVMEVTPNSPAGWLHQAYALRRVEGGGLQAAWDALFPVAEQFAEEPTIPFNLACYACQMARLDEARRWLKQAMEVGGAAEIKKMALNDPDLQPLWEEIRERAFA